MFAEKEGVNAGVSAVICCYPNQDVNVALLANIQGHEEEPLAAIHRQLSAG